MGMLDQMVPFSENFRLGEVFLLQDAKKSAPIQTEYGTEPAAMLKIADKWYSAFGRALVNQVDRMDDDDRRAMRAGNFRVKMVMGTTRSGQDVKLIMPADAPTDDAGRLQEDVPAA